MNKCPKCFSIWNTSEHNECPQCSGYNAKQEKMDRFYMDIAFRASELSHAIRLKVGAILVNDNNILSFGWNGMPSGFDNCCEIDENTTKPEVIHAEINTFAKLAKTTGHALGSTLYITDSPCFDCCKMVIQSGITRLVYSRPYRDDRPLDFMKKAGLIVKQLV